MAEKIKVVELFAGVGGFRLGLEGWKGCSPTSGYKAKFKTAFQIIWSSQWEPSTKKQDASEVYEKRFGSEGHSNEDISTVPISMIPDHDLLVGGFPCQDYSVARTLSQSSGLKGKKGVLWWQIHRILLEKKNKPKYLLLENVDRLLNSPAKDRGRDFAIMLASLSDLGYIVEWRIINAADYGMPQRRKRVFILGYHKSTRIFKQLTKKPNQIDWVTKNGVIADEFCIDIVEETSINSFFIDGDIVSLSEKFNKKFSFPTPFLNTGIMVNRNVLTFKSTPNYDGPRVTLGDVLSNHNEVPKQFFIQNDALEKWQYLKGAKNEKRINKSTGFEYAYTEGSMSFPDNLDKSSRTIITGEGGAAPSRFKHVVKVKGNVYRRLTPVELERLNMFPDNHTDGVSDIKRAFLMGNALVVGIVEKLGNSLKKRI
jgi:DNA (cytosine-5)-methyltransferase 1